MYIDISGPPPSSLAQEKKRYLRIIIVLLGMILFAVLLGIVRVVYDTGHDTVLENIALVLFVGAGFTFVYFSEKLQAYKPLTKEQQGKIEELCRQYPDIAAYRDMVATTERDLILAEYEAFTAHVDRVKGEKKESASSK